MNRSTHGVLYIALTMYLFHAKVDALAQIQTSLDYSMLVEGMEDLSRSAVYIQTPQKYGTGTLFSVPYSDTATTGAAYLATARHVLWKFDKAGKVVGLWDTASVFFQLRTGGMEERRYRVIMTPANLDIAILKPLDFYRPFKEYHVYALSTNDIARPSELGKGQFAFLAGFPFRLGIKTKEHSAIVQSGITSFVDTISSLVLVDIPVNLGNSGCPVYVVTKSREAKLMGLVFQYQPSTEDVVFRGTTRQEVPANSSLGRVVMLHSILEDISKLRR